MDDTDNSTGRKEKNKSLGRKSDRPRQKLLSTRYLQSYRSVQKRMRARRKASIKIPLRRFPGWLPGEIHFFFSFNSLAQIIGNLPQRLSFRLFAIVQERAPAQNVLPAPFISRTLSNTP